MSDPAEIRQKVERLMKRAQHRDPYSRLLREGSAEDRVSDLEDPDAWQAEIKRQAQEDRISVRTGINGGLVWAEVLGAGAAQQEDLLQMNRVFQAVLPVAVEHRHEPKSLVADQGEFALGCERCSAIGYVDGTAEPPQPAGPLFEEHCPEKEPPRETKLTILGGGKELKRIWDDEGKPS